MKEPLQAVFIDEDAPGAIKRGTPIVKIKTEPTDANPVGTTGIVLGSVSVGEGMIGYFVEWQTSPGVPVFVAGFKIGQQQ